MHEASLMKDLMRQIENVARIEGSQRVTSVSVWLGALSHMSAQHFAEHFAQASVGTVAEGARLNFTVSHNIRDVDAQRVRLENVEVES